jgi:hypothetical protein
MGVVEGDARFDETDVGVSSSDSGESKPHSDRQAAKSLSPASQQTRSLLEGSSERACRTIKLQGHRNVPGEP